MSLVGTRPILQDELRQYELHHRARIAIKPGITGMWQVSGRSDITDFEEVVRLDTEYISKSQSVLFGENVNKNVAIVYSPLNGTGLKPVTRTLQEMGYTNITVVKEQEQPDGHFPTCPYPNPEIKEAMALGISLLDKLDELYKTYGYCLNTLHSYEFDGSAGFARMQSIMQAFRGGIKEFGGKKVVRLLDYVQGLDGLPKSDVLKFLLEDNCSLVVRPSGTEPKLKIYISVSAENKEMAEEVEDEIAKTAEKWIC